MYNIWEQLPESVLECLGQDPPKPGFRRAAVMVSLVDQGGAHGLGSVVMVGAADGRRTLSRRHDAGHAPGSLSPQVLAFKFYGQLIKKAKHL